VAALAVNPRLKPAKCQHRVDVSPFAALPIGAGLPHGGSPRAFGPGLWPGPRRQARWVGRGLRRSRVGPEDRFCEAVGNDLRVPLTLEGPTRTIRGVPLLGPVTFSQLLAHSA
jgi:hypothetical protein